MNSIQKLVIIGSGNVATHLSMAFKDAGLDILGVYSPTYGNARILSDRLNAEAYASMDLIPHDADAYLLAVSDSALVEVISKVTAFDGILMHTSGSVGLDVFVDNLSRSAVFYPLQTFSKAKQIDFSSVPILIESNDKQLCEMLHVLGSKISRTVKDINSKQRRQLHLAAVFACNFSNYMFHVSEELLKDNDLDFDLLKPLIKETVDKLEVLSPKEAQTGPAIRQDIKTLNQHIQILDKHPEYQRIYHLISDQIQKLKF